MTKPTTTQPSASARTVRLTVAPRLGLAVPVSSTCIVNRPPLRPDAMPLGGSIRFSPGSPGPLPTSALTPSLPLWWRFRLHPLCCPAACCYGLWFPSFCGARVALWRQLFLSLLGQFDLLCCLSFPPISSRAPVPCQLLGRLLWYPSFNSWFTTRCA
jgi:hypothetical protein